MLETYVNITKMYIFRVNGRGTKEGIIAGAGSDVFETEPLQAESPLWDLPNMIITPHCTPEMPDIPANCVEIITENIRRFRNGEALINAIGKENIYTK